MRRVGVGDADWASDMALWQVAEIGVPVPAEDVAAPRDGKAHADFAGKERLAGVGEFGVDRHGPGSGYRHIVGAVKVRIGAFKDCVEFSLRR